MVAETFKDMCTDSKNMQDESLISDFSLLGYFLTTT